jgi:hypothetical protein
MRNCLLTIAFYLDDQVRLPPPRDHDKHDSSFMDPQTTHKDVPNTPPNVHQSSAPQSMNPRLNSINTVWLESRRFHLVLSDPALDLLRKTFNLSLVPR